MNARNVVVMIKTMADVAQQKRRKEELRRIWENRQDGWWKYGDEMVELGVCTELELHQALCWGEG